MSQIRFLHDFTASRVVRDRCLLKKSEAATAVSESGGISFSHCLHRFPAGQTDFVRRVIRSPSESLLVITDNPVVGEVVLDDAREGVDFEVIA